MKNKLAIAICCIAALAVVASTKIQKHEVVILEASSEVYEYRLNVGGCGDGYVGAGFIVNNCSSSAGAPAFTPYYRYYQGPCAGQTNKIRTSAAQALADLLDQGYEIKAVIPHTGPPYFGGMTYTLVRN